MLNTHTRYLHENILHYAEDILSTMPDDLTASCSSALVPKPTIWPFA